MTCKLRSKEEVGVTVRWEEEKREEREQSRQETNKGCTSWILRDSGASGKLSRVRGFVRWGLQELVPVRLVVQEWYQLRVLFQVQQEARDGCTEGVSEKVSLRTKCGGKSEERQEWKPGACSELWQKCKQSLGPETWLWRLRNGIDSR